ncbi:DUF5672 family protein [Polynucleobacter asymbioticus]|uniref:DUF5672 family protein n=1 Tax=Polynucleobacter asymbioticus TaxID=576611 RepID=UPI0008F96120|nr:DUF5672 family protein [Polynucleobacter asymbioticus]
MAKNRLNPLVLVPIHKSESTELESISLRRCGEIFKNRDVAILSPDNISLDAYRQFFPTHKRLSIDPFWMSSIRSYNKLMCSPFIWLSLEGYSHVLIHEPDAFVLSDELDLWCNKNIDYIGSPWLEGWHQAKDDANIIGVGNFGFSLHRLDFYREFFSTPHGNRWFNYQGNCDLFWCLEVPKYFKINIASFEEALKFAWEAAPKRCLELSGNAMPFGLHAWNRYDQNFIISFLKENGITLKM